MNPIKVKIIAIIQLVDFGGKLFPITVGNMAMFKAMSSPPRARSCQLTEPALPSYMPL